MLYEEHNPVLSMVAGSSSLPKLNNSKPLGEDAHFILHEANAIGIADGVSGWSRIGIDAGDYSSELMNNVMEAINKRGDSIGGGISGGGGGIGGVGGVDPKYVLEESFSKTEADGSSTACILTLDSITLRAANVGDSGFLVMRGGKIAYASPTQQHKFNHPYQLGKTSGCDTPDVAEEITVAVESYDVIIAGTDDFFDNIFPQDIEEVVMRCVVENQQGPELVAWTLAEVARQISFLEYVCTSFQTDARKAGVRHSGGKYDDVTVAVAYVFPAAVTKVS